MFRDAQTQQTAMSKLHFFSHPEIESRSSLSVADEAATCGHRTLLDLLEIYFQKVLWKERLDHTPLLHHFQQENFERVNNPELPHPLRIFFVEDLNFGTHSSSLDPDSQSTPHWFHNHFGVTPVFLDCLRAPKQSVTIGNASFIRREQGGRVALDGMYRYSADLSAPPRPPRPPAHVWFSQSLTCDRGSTYIIHHCPDEARRLILSCAMGSNFQSLLRPLAIDIFLAEDCVTKWVQRVSQTRNELLKYESPLPHEMNHEITAKAVEDLYQVCQLFQIIRDILADLKDQFDYLATVLGQCNLSLHFPPVPGDELDDTSVAESLNFLRSKNQILSRWVVNYTERTEVQINRLFSHATHKDSAINLNISQLTSKIAVSSQRDSSAMITMAAVTMFFLPGTFVSAFFSMVFFNSQTNTAGKTSFYVAPQWWIFPAVTIPLTIFVFVIWMIWRHLRDKKRLGELISARQAGRDCCGHVQEIS